MFNEKAILFFLRCCLGARGVQFRSGGKRLLASFLGVSEHFEAPRPQTYGISSAQAPVRFLRLFFCPLVSTKGCKFGGVD